MFSFLNESVQMDKINDDFKMDTDPKKFSKP